MADTDLNIIMRARDEASQAMNRLHSELARLGPSASSAGSAANRAGSQIASLTSHAQNSTSILGGLVNGLGRLGLAAMGISALASAAKGLGESLGIGLNVEMENVTAQLNAFTKDGAKSAAILADIRKEADQTPFAFNEMATATAGLMSSAKMANEPLMDLVKTAEILAASNPAEGLRGAAFALREAVSGDFTSIIERFNLPRSYINQLKDEGIPALEAVRKAMLSMGYDADLVSNMAKTLTGRWSTFNDTIDGIKAKISQPLFDRLKSGLEAMQGWFDSNKSTIDTWAAYVAAGIDLVAGGIADLAGVFWQSLSGIAETVTSVGMQIYEALQWLNPFASHSAPLVDQVEDGAALIKGALVSIAGSVPALKSVAAAERDVTQALKQSAPAANTAKTNLAGFKATVQDSKGRLDDLTGSLNRAKDGLNRFSGMAIQGSKAFKDQFDAIQDQINQTELAIVNFQFKGAEYAAAHQDELHGLEAALTTLRARADRLRLNEAVQLDPLRRQLEDLKKPMQELPFEELARGIKESKAQVDDLTPQVEAASEVYKEQQKALQGVTEASKGLSGAISPIQEVSDAMKDAKGQVDEFKHKVNEARTNIENALGPVAVFLTDNVVTPFIAAKNAAGDLASGPLQYLADTVIPALSKAAKFLSEHMDEVKGALIAIAVVLAGAAVVSAIVGIVMAIASLVTPLGLIIAAVALLGAAWAGNWGDIQGKTKAVISFIGPLIQKSLEGWTRWWAEHGDSVMKVVGALWENLQRGWAMMMAGIEVILDAFGAFWAAHGETITKVARFMWENIQIVAKAAMKILGLLFDAFAALSEGNWHTFGQKLRDIWDIAWKAIGTILRNSIDILRDLAGDIAKAIWNKITSTDWPAVGKAIVEGLVKGVRNNWNAFFDVIKELAKAAWEAITGFFDTGSPSKLMASLGRDIVAGLGLGVSSKMGEVVKLFTDWGGVLFAEMEAWGQGIGGIPAWIVQQFVREFGRLPATISEFDDFLNRRGWRDPESGEWRFPDEAQGVGKPGFSLTAAHKIAILTGFAKIGEEFSSVLSATVSAFTAAMQRIEGSIDTGLLSRAADAAGGLLSNLQKLGRTLSIEGTTALEIATKMFGDMVTKASIVNQIKDLVSGFESLGLSLPPDLLFAIQDIASAVGGPFADAIKKFLDLAPERKALADLQAFINEFQLGQQLATAVAGMMAAGLEIPQTLLDMLKKVPRTVGSYLDRIINQILGINRPLEDTWTAVSRSDSGARRQLTDTWNNTVTFTGPIYVRNDEDIEILAYRVSDVIRRHR